MSCFYVSNILTIFFLQATYFRYNKICIIPTLVFKPQISIVRIVPYCIKYVCLLKKFSAIILRTPTPSRKRRKA